MLQGPALLEAEESPRKGDRGDRETCLTLGVTKSLLVLLANWLITVVIKGRVAFPERALEVRVSRRSLFCPGSIYEILGGSCRRKWVRVWRRIALGESG